MHLQPGIIHIDKVHRMIRNAAMANKKILTQSIHPPRSIQSSQEELGVGWSCVMMFCRLRRLFSAPVIFEKCILSGIYVQQVLFNKTQTPPVDAVRISKAMWF
ncbi:hypothetical protein XENOCAPTIV_027119 [Xenoophorus captivus]|uniref:Uncharacterized protein n=1 Tax=Xenoophorus captivus TaxID=1517983 RepID=A0ABV0QTQ5_9TELE